MTHCWCGNRGLSAFGGGYRHCPRCQTLVSEYGEADADYSPGYWFDHQSGRGQPDLPARARGDLPERCVHWLRTLLKYRPPPARVLEIASAHGGFVALLGLAGYNATGLELSPAIVEFARRTFAVSLLEGAVETQPIGPGSLDAVVMIDVLEHLPHPNDTIRHLTRLLAPDGLLLIQTPQYREGLTLAQLEAAGNPFLSQMRGIEREHLYLYSQPSVTGLLAGAGLGAVQFETAIFAHYDMYLAASRQPLGVCGEAEQTEALLATPGGRMVQALLDAAADRDYYLDEARKRMDVIDGLSRELDRLRAAKRPWFG